MAAGQVFNRGDHRHRVVDRQGHAALRLHDRAGADRGLPVGRHGRAAARAAADAGGRLADALDARRSRRDDLGLAQSLRGQRHQAVRPRRLQALRRGRDARSRRWSRRPTTMQLAAPAAIGRAKRLDDADGRYIEAVKALVRARPRPRRPQDRGRLRQRRRLQGRADRAVGARRRGDPDRRRAGRLQHQRQLRLDPSRRCCRSTS